MQKFLIEIPHSPDEASCEHALQVFLRSGSHFLTHADWGCMDGEHKAWMIVEVDNKEEAQGIVPPYFREDAKVIRLISYSPEGFRHPDEYHTGK